MNHIKYLLGSLFAFILATLHLWLPALVFTIGGSEATIKACQELAKGQELFTMAGFALLMVGIYYYMNR